MRCTLTEITTPPPATSPSHSQWLQEVVGDQALHGVETNGVNTADLARLDNTADAGITRIVALALSDEQHAFRRAGGDGHLQRCGERMGHWLFNQDVFAGAQCRERERMMLGVGGEDEHGLHIVASQ